PGTGEAYYADLRYARLRYAELRYSPRASAARRRPIAGANLKPWPEHAEPTTMRPRRSSTKPWSTVEVYVQVSSSTGTGSTPGKRSGAQPEMRWAVAGSGSPSVSGSTSGPAWWAPAFSPWTGS